MNLSVRMLLLLASALPAINLTAKSPGSPSVGQRLFQQEWSPTSIQGGDGLGPLFNAKSCVACHHQAGVGGGGDSRFNAKTLGFDWLKLTGEVAQHEEAFRQFGRTQLAQQSGGRLGAISLPPEVGVKTTNPLRGRPTSVPVNVARAVSGFHPGLVTPSGGVTTSFTIPHHGGTSQFEVARNQILNQLPIEFSPQGGPLSASDVRLVNATPIMYSAPLSNGAVTIRAHLYQRNTPALFGAGLINQVTGEQRMAIANQQARHPEISGRVSGLFGWRGNVPNLLDFCEQACANEIGLSTQRNVQPVDPTNPQYMNPHADISNPMILAMTSFVAALPAPERVMPMDEAAQATVQRGQQMFAQVGCAICHVPDVGPAKGIYSDLLLHDMGSELVDLNVANPVPVKRNGITIRRSSANPSPNRMPTTDPEKRKQELLQAKQNPRSSRSTTVPRRRRSTSTPSRRLQTQTRQTTSTASRPTMVGYYGGGSTLSNMIQVAPGEYVFPPKPSAAQTSLPTNTAQEWRTPPLWGVRDSAPYMHDGRAATLLEAITMHEGESRGTRDRFLSLPLDDRHAIIEFLLTMQAPSSAIPSDAGGIAFK